MISLNFYLFGIVLIFPHFDRWFFWVFYFVSCFFLRSQNSGLFPPPVSMSFMLEKLYFAVLLEHINLIYFICIFAKDILLTFVVLDGKSLAIWTAVTLYMMYSFWVFWYFIVILFFLQGWLWCSCMWIYLHSAYLG